MGFICRGSEDERPIGSDFLAVPMVIGSIAHVGHFLDFLHLGYTVSYNARSLCTRCLWAGDVVRARNCRGIVFSCLPSQVHLMCALLVEVLSWRTLPRLP